MTTHKPTDPKIIAELRELIANAQPAPWDLGTGWPFGNWNWDGMSDERKKATERIVVHLFNHAASLLADSERLAEAEKQHGNLLAELNLCRPYRSQYNALTERLREAEKKISELSLECHSYLTQLSQPHEDPRLRLAVEVIEKYRTSHLHGCASEIRGQPCSCGFDDAIAKIGRTE